LVDQKTDVSVMSIASLVCIKLKLILTRIL